MDTLEELHYFASPIYIVTKTEFLESVQIVSDRYINHPKDGQKQIVTMSGNYAHEPELQDFGNYVSQTAWNILLSQGYDMDSSVTFFQEMWTQEHNKLSSMDTHVHGFGAQISAFYFLKVPENGCRVIIHDPRPGKVIISLPIKNDVDVSSGSNQIVFTPQAGTMMFMNSWLPHSFSRNVSEDPTIFVHMNLSVAPAPSPAVEII